MEIADNPAIALDNPVIALILSILLGPLFIYLITAIKYDDWLWPVHDYPPPAND